MPAHEVAGPEPRRTVVDGNALAGRLRALFAVDVTTLIVECGACGATGPVATTVVEIDDAIAIVRCRDCTHTLFTVLGHEQAPVLRPASLARLAAPAPGS